MSTNSNRPVTESISEQDASNKATTASITTNKKPAIRYVEARRVGTCAFANRIASLSIQHYKKYINESIRTNVLPQTCIATIVAAFHTDTNTSTTESVHTTTSSTTSTDSTGSAGRYNGPIQQLHVLAMGVGTKFLSESILQADESISMDTSTPTNNPYGTQVRDCHAEVLCRRAFRKYLLHCIELLQHQHNQQQQQQVDNQQQHYSNYSILQQCVNLNCDNNINGDNSQNSTTYQLRKDVTLHMYCSSTPCGNSTIKKFASLQKEIYCTTLNDDTWPSNDNDHTTIDPIIGHSIPLGQFALLVKKDSNSNNETFSKVITKTIENTDIAHGAKIFSAQNTNEKQHQELNNYMYTRILSKKEQSYPIYTSLDWCPPGTTTVWSNSINNNNTGGGSIHTCSDKIGRWNILGYQGSLLSYYIPSKPIYISTVTIGRKFSSNTCRRAICCRFTINPNKNKKAKHDNKSTNEAKNKSIDYNKSIQADEYSGIYQLHHPTVMGTSVYMDNTGVIDMSIDNAGTIASTSDFNCLKSDTVTKVVSNTTSDTTQVRFHSSMSFVTWIIPPTNGNEYTYGIECINGSTGYIMDMENVHHDQNRSINDSKTSTNPSKVCTHELLKHFVKLHTSSDVPFPSLPNTLQEYRKYKRRIATSYEEAKYKLLTEHPILRDWKRRRVDSIDITNKESTPST